MSFDRDLRPLLGNVLVAGVPEAEGALGESSDGGRSIAAALKTEDEEALGALLERLPLEAVDETEGATLYGGAAGLPWFARDRDVLVAADDEETLRSALARPDGDEHLTLSAWRTNSRTPRTTRSFGP